MQCHDLDAWVDALAADQDAPPDIAAHVTACARCRRALANARAVELALRDREQPRVPPDFTIAVMARVRRERWRSEQILDWSFNAAVAAGIALVAVGLAGLAWATGLISIGGDMMTLVATASDIFAARVAQEVPTISVAVLLLTMTLALWWWVQADPTI
jgi:anti-sigma factor RsiW